MPQRILVKESGFLNLLKSFFSAKEKGPDAESDWLRNLRKRNPKLAKVWEETDIAHLDSLLTFRKNMKTDKGKKEIEDIIIKRGYAKNRKEVENLAKKRNIN